MHKLRGSGRGNMHRSQHCCTWAIYVVLHSCMLLILVYWMQTVCCPRKQVEQGAMYIHICTYWPSSSLYHYPWVSLLPLCSRRSNWPWESIATISSISSMLVHKWRSAATFRGGSCLCGWCYCRLSTSLCSGISSSYIERQQGVV